MKIIIIIRVVLFRTTSSSSLMCLMLYGSGNVVLCFFDIYLKHSRTPKIEVIIVGLAKTSSLSRKPSHVNFVMKTMHREEWEERNKIHGVIRRKVKFDCTIWAK